VEISLFTFLLVIERDQFEKAYKASTAAIVRFLFEAKAVFLRSPIMVRTDDSISVFIPQGFFDSFWLILLFVFFRFYYYFFDHWPNPLVFKLHFFNYPKKNKDLPLVTFSLIHLEKLGQIISISFEFPVLNGSKVLSIEQKMTLLSSMNT